MLTFLEFLAIQEGMWLNDKLAIPGLSATPPPTPPKKGKWPKPPKLKPAYKTCESMDQLHRNVADLGKLGIGLFPPKKEDLERLLDKYKSQVAIPQRPKAATGATGCSSPSLSDGRPPERFHAAFKATRSPTRRS